MTSSQHRRTSLARRAAGWATSTAVLLVILFCAAWIAPSLFGFSRYVITGPSMTGTYDRGSVVFEKPVPVEDLKVGDVITYTPPADSGVTWLVTHRIVDIQPAEGGGLLFTTKGDHNPDPDPWHFKLLSSEQPVVQFGVPHAGWAFIALADRDVRMVVIGGPAALVALMALGELVGALRERRRGSAPAPLPARATVPPQREPETVPVTV